MTTKPVWEEYVPIIQTKDSIFVYLTKKIGGAYHYDRLHHELVTATRDTTIVLVISSSGGALFTALSLADTIKESAATVKAYLTGNVASAATVIALACDTLNVSTSTMFGIHNLKLPAGASVPTSASHLLADTWKTIYKDFLTEAEVGAVQAGDELWLSAKDVKHRWNMRNKTRNKEDGK